MKREKYKSLRIDEGGAIILSFLGRVEVTTTIQLICGVLGPCFAVHDPILVYFRPTLVGALVKGFGFIAFVW